MWLKKIINKKFFLGKGNLVLEIVKTKYNAKT